MAFYAAPPSPGHPLPAGAFPRRATHRSPPWCAACPVWGSRRRGSDGSRSSPRRGRCRTCRRGRRPHTGPCCRTGASVKAQLCGGLPSPRALSRSLPQAAESSAAQGTAPPDGPVRHSDARPRGLAGWLWGQQRPHGPDVQMERHALLYLQLFSTPRRLEYALLCRLGVVLHQLAIEEPTRGAMARTTVASVARPASGRFCPRPGHLGEPAVLSGRSRSCPDLLNT